MYILYLLMYLSIYRTEGKHGIAWNLFIFHFDYYHYYYDHYYYYHHPEIYLGLQQYPAI